MKTAHETTDRPTRQSRPATYRVYHDPDSSRKITTDLVFAVRSITGDDPTEMLPLNRAVDPDVLESHVQGRQRDAHLSFDFQGYHVAVRDDGRIEFTLLDDQEA